jgi:hypothetical protein
VWNGITKEERSFLSFIPEPLTKGFNSTEMRVDFKNGSFYQVVGSDDVNRLVGTNPIGVVLSEYSLQDPGAWDYIRPILAENGGWALFIYTPRGKNHGYDLYEMARNNRQWFCEKLIAGNNGTKRHDGTPVVSDEAIQKERDEGMPEETVQQEFFGSFESPLVGSYYSNEMTRADLEGRICKVLHESDLPVHTYWDLGMDDSTTIWFVQFVMNEIRLIDYYECSGEGAAHYASVLFGEEQHSRHRSFYNYGSHTAPHDIKVREWGGGKSRLEAAARLGIKFRICPKIELLDGIQAVRSIFSRCIFDKDRCKQGIRCLKEYRKEWDDINLCFSTRPVRDWATHGADGFRTMATSIRHKPRDGSDRQRKAVDTFNYAR